MYLMFGEICITLVCRNKFRLCRASGMSFLFMGGLLMSMSCLWISYTLAVRVDLSLAAIVQGLWGSSWFRLSLFGSFGLLVLSSGMVTSLPAFNVFCWIRLLSGAAPPGGRVRPGRWLGPLGRRRSAPAPGLYVRPAPFGRVCGSVCPSGGSVWCAGWLGWVSLWRDSLLQIGAYLG